MKKNLICLFLILILSLLLCEPLLGKGFYVFHDDQQIGRLFLFDEALRDGQFPPRWVSELGFGFGYPLFIFYPPFVYMLGELFHLVGFSFVESVKLVFITSIIASAFAMYIMAKELWGRVAGTTAAIFYILAPYRAVDVYVRGALAESFSFVWLPLTIWSFTKLAKEQKIKYSLLGSIFLALLLITHNLVFMPFMLLLLPYLLFLFTTVKRKRQLIFLYASSFILAFGLAAFFWIPAIFEKRFTIIDELLLINLANYKIHFVYLTQLWNSSWGFGGSTEGLTDGISFKIGKLHIISAFAALTMYIIHFLKERGNTRSNVNYQLSIVFFILFMFSAFMTTKYSQVVWEAISPLGYIQFPWRFLIFTTLLTSTLAGAFIYSLKLPILKIVFLSVFAFALLFTNIKLFKPLYGFELTDTQATAEDVLNTHVSSSSFEYLPKGVELYVGPLGTNLVNIKPEEITKNKIEIVKGEAIINKTYEKSNSLRFQINSQGPTTLKINTFFYPGWSATVDGEEVAITNQNKLKLITLAIPQGNHSVELRFNNTSIRKIANAISLISIAALFYLVKAKKNATQ